jgi:hypothetical protein
MLEGSYSPWTHPSRPKAVPFISSARSRMLGVIATSRAAMAASPGPSPPAGRPDQVEQQPDGGRLAGAVGPENPNTWPGRTARSSSAIARLRP